MSKIATVAVDNLIATMNAMVKTIEEVLENGQAGARTQRGVAALNEVIAEIVDLTSIFAEPVAYDLVSGMSIDASSSERITNIAGKKNSWPWRKRQLLRCWISKRLVCRLWRNCSKPRLAIS